MTEDSFADEILNEAKKPRPEKELYKPILDFLNTRQATLAWQHYNGGIWLPGKETYARKANHQDGIPDILGVKAGKPFAFEIKKPGKDATDEQRRWMEKFISFGGTAFICDSLEDVMEAWKEI